MTAPIFAPVDEPMADFLALIVDPWTPLGYSDADDFLSACQYDAAAHGGLVSVNRVRELLTAADIEHHRFSAMWSHFTGREKPMRKATLDDTSMPWEICRGSQSGNDGRPYPLRIWVGWTS